MEIQVSSQELFDFVRELRELISLVGKYPRLNSSITLLGLRLLLSETDRLLTGSRFAEIGATSCELRELKVQLSRLGIDSNTTE